jgi:hypothetical protein
MSEESAEKQNGFRIASDPILSEEGKVQGSEGQSPIGPTDKLKFEDLGPLPTGYGEMFLVARDPHWLFTYWDFDYAKLPTPRKLFLEVYRDEELESTIEINELARNWYIPVHSAATAYTVVFGYRDATDAWTRLGKAGPTRTPPESISANWDTQFATVPFHLSFNFLLDVISAARAQGQRLTEALARLQQEASSWPGGASSWGIEQMKVLETLLGKNFLDRLFSMSSQEVLEFLHGELSGNLDSESASELLAKGRLASLLAPGESSLFSGVIREFVRQELSSGGVSSFGGAEVGGVSSQLGGVSSEVGGVSSEVLVGGSETLASWQAGVREIISKWEQAVSSLGLSSEVLASWQAGLSVITISFAKAISSLGLGSEVLASWQAGLREVAGSFAQAISSYGLSSETLASWQAGISESFAKWESALSSYALGSEVLASWQAGLGAITSSWETVLSSYSLSSETLASWQAALGAITSSWETALSSYSLSSETLASWQAALGAITSSWETALSSYSLSSETLASWQAALGAIPSSWSWETAFGSLGVSSFSFASEQLSSLSLSSWSGLEFGLSSWSQLVSESSLFSGIGASWSGQPFSQPERKFFMHVNAEVIFYGGTDPQAKVTIAGRPVQLQPDGTFRYHFKFPDNEFEIPIVAVSPDGVETRSATLFLQRDTARYGDVSATAQPEHLGVPMGQRLMSK